MIQMLEALVKLLEYAILGLHGPVLCIFDLMHFPVLSAYKDFFFILT